MRDVVRFYSVTGEYGVFSNYLGRILMAVRQAAAARP
jgi:predicted NAD-dependent protein-ADP-ribosyltransferase YbiA (DUF1768 family)